MPENTLKELEATPLEDDAETLKELEAVPVEDDSDFLREIGARPVEDSPLPTKKVFIEDKGKVLEVPASFHSGLVGWAARETFWPELSKFTGETFKASVRGILTSGQEIGALVKFVGDHVGSEPPAFMEKSPRIAAFEDRVKQAIFDQGDLMIDTYSRLRDQGFTIGGVEMAKADPEIFSGTFMQHPSWTRAAAIVTEAIPSLATAAAITYATKTPFAGASSLGILEGAGQREEARRAGKTGAALETVFALSALGTTLLESLPLAAWLKHLGADKAGLEKALKGAVKIGAFEGLEETTQTFWQNLIAKVGYEPTRNLFEGMVESFIAGAGSGGALGALSAFGPRKLETAIGEAQAKGLSEREIEGVGESIVGEIIASQEEIDQILRDESRLAAEQAQIQELQAQITPKEPLEVMPEPEIEEVEEEPPFPVKIIDNAKVIDIQAQSNIDKALQILAKSTELEGENLFESEKVTIEEARKKGEEFYFSNLFGTSIQSPAFGNEKILFDEEGWKHITEKEREKGRKITDEDIVRRLKLLSKVVPILQNAKVVENFKENEDGSNTFSVLGKFNDGSVVRVVVREFKRGGKKFFSVFDVEDLGKKIRRLTLPKSPLPGAGHGVGKAPSAPSKPSITPEVTPSQEPSPETLEPEEGEVSFEFGENIEEEFSKVESEIEKLPEEEVDPLFAEVEMEALKERLAFRKRVGKFRRFKKGFLKEELSQIPSFYFTRDPSAQTLDEKAEGLGYERSDDLVQAILAFERYRPQGEARLEELKELVKNYAKSTRRASAQRQKELAQFISRIESALKKRLPATQIKRIVRIKTGQIEALPRMVTEMQALKASLHAQARAAAQAVKATKQELKELKSGLVDIIQLRVPTEARGKFLRMVANVQTARDVVKVSSRIEKVADEVLRKELLRAIKNQAKRIEKSRLIAIDYVQRIRALLDRFELQAHQKDFLQELKETQDFIDERRKEGEDVALPQYVLNRLQILKRRPLSEIETPILINILNDMGRLAELGKTKLGARQELDEARKKQDLRDLLEGSRRLEEKEIIRAKIGEVLNPEQVRKNAIHQLVNFIQRAGLAITPMDVIFDRLDGDKGFTGPNYRIFKKNIDQAYSDFLTLKRELSQEAVKLANDLGLEDVNFEMIGFVAARNQEGGFEKLEALGYTAQEIEAVKLDEREETLYSAMRRTLDSLRPKIAEVMRTVYNEELGTVRNYFPFMTNFEEMSDFEIRERFGDKIPEFGQAPRKEVERGFTKERVGGRQKIKLHAMEIFLRHLDNAAYLVTVGQHTRRLGDIAKTEEYREAAGELGQEIVVDWMDTIARKGKMAGERYGFLDALRQNVGIATLGFKLSSALIQPSALMDGASIVGKEVFEGAQRIATDKTWREFVFKNFPEIQARVGDDPAFLEFGGVRKEVADKAFWVLQRLDLVTAASVASGAYLKFVRAKGLDLDLANPNPEAINWAQLMVRRSQSSAFFKDAPQAITRGKLTRKRDLDRLFLQFQTFMLNRWSMIRHEGYRLGFKAGNVNQGMNVLTFLTLANIAEYGLRAVSSAFIALFLLSLGFEPDDDDEKFEDGFTTKIVGEILDEIPIVSQVVNTVAYGSVPVPSIEMVRKAGDALKSFARSKRPEKKLTHFIRAAILISGLAGAPGTVQADQVIREVTSGDTSKEPLA